jgi:hypothetical protein
MADREPRKPVKRLPRAIPEGDWAEPIGPEPAAFGKVLAVSRLDAEIAELLAVRAAAVALLEAVEALPEPWVTPPEESHFTDCWACGTARGHMEGCEFAAVVAAAKKLREAMK